MLPALVVIVPVACYALGVARLRRRLGRRWSTWRTAGFALGTVLAAAALSPPLSDLAHADARGHMAQHLLLGMYAPLALVLAAPVTLLLGATPLAARGAVGAVLRSRPVQVLSHPVTAAVLSVGGLYLLYLTPLYAASAQSAPLHHLVHLHFLAAGALYVWAIAGPDPAPHRPGTAMRVSVLLLSAAAHAYLAKLIYARAGDLPPGGSHGIQEMQHAAQVMYYGGDVAEILLAVALFAGWYRLRGRERRPRTVLTRR